MTVGLRLMPLNGRPGVISARYAGLECDDEANNDKVLEEMKGAPRDDRNAVFVAYLPWLGMGSRKLFRCL